MDFLHRPGHEALRRGRWSMAGAEYFLTICTQNRAAGLHASALGMMLLTEADQLTSTRHWDLRTGVIMPDHLHLLVTLGEHSELSDVVRLFKGRLVGALRAAGMQWQRGFFDHRMRPDEDRLPVFLYIFLNAYRAELLHADDKWQTYFCCLSDWQWFGPLTNVGCTWPEWLQPIKNEDA